MKKVEGGMKGVIALTFCPGCMRQMLTLEQARKLALTLKSSLKDNKDTSILITSGVMNPLASKFNPDIVCMEVAIPVSQDAIEKSGRRAVIYPLCKECYTRIYDLEFEKKKDKVVLDSINDPSSRIVLDF